MLNLDLNLLLILQQSIIIYLFSKIDIALVCVMFNMETKQTYAYFTQVWFYCSTNYRQRKNMYYKNKH